jgi:hypothetical protein
MPPIERPWLVRVDSNSVEVDIYRSTTAHAQSRGASS